MLFLSPLWLAMLLPPWAAVAWWLLRGRRDRAEVPFLHLWRNGGDAIRSSNAFHAPPWALVAALLAVLLAIAAAARPVVKANAEAGDTITVVFDRGNTMSAGNRRAEVLDLARRGIGQRTVELIVVPAATDASGSDWFEIARSLPPTDADTGEAVRLAVRQALARDEQSTVVVLSDRTIPPEQGTRIVQIAPTGAIQNVGITRFIVRDSRPRGQAMITVRNDSEQATATLSVDGVAGVAQEIRLSPRGQEMNYFLDLPAVSASATATLTVADDFAADNVAYAARERAWPAVEIRSPVPPEVRRVVEAYQRTRPARQNSARVAIVGSGDVVPADLAAAIVSASGPAGEASAGPIAVAAHPIVAGVAWQEITPRPTGEPPAPANGWTPILSVGGKSAVAVRAEPRRQAWVGVDLTDFARTPEFVVLWTNVIDWLGGSGDAGSSDNPLTGSVGAVALGAEWERSGGGNGPGVYRRGDGALRAISAPPVRIDPLPASDGRASLAALRTRSAGRRDLTSAVLLAALACLVVAASVWTGRRLTAFPDPRTV